MDKIELVPLYGIKINNSLEIKLDSKIETVTGIIGLPESIEGEQYFYDKIKARFDFNKKNKLEFIEFIDGPFFENIELSIYGINPFKTFAKELVGILLKNGDNNVDDSEADYCYSFPKISVGVWREFTEETIQKDIMELKEVGEYEKYKNDLLKSKYFWTIGIGNKNYYK